MAITTLELKKTIVELRAENYRLKETLKNITLVKETASKMEQYGSGGGWCAAASTMHRLAKEAI